MRLILFILVSVILYNCQQANSKKHESPVLNIIQNDSVRVKSYQEIKKDIISRRKEFSSKYSLSDSLSKEAVEEICNYWVNTVSNDLFSKWQNTPWDFNGTTTLPQQGTIACGYFVNTILQDMDLKINRIKLSVCASSQMMKTLTPQQKLKNLSFLDYVGFNNKLKEFGKGVYIIGLDYHTGFIVHDGSETWFIHSNYIGRKGVTKETVLNSAALKASKTRWLISLTSDIHFLKKWLKG